MFFGDELERERERGRERGRVRGRDVTVSEKVWGREGGRGRWSRDLVLP